MSTSNNAWAVMALVACKCQRCDDFYASATADKMGLFTATPTTPN